MMTRIVKIKVGSVVYEIPENAVANYPHLLMALQQQGSSETPQTETQTPFSGMETGEIAGSEEASEQSSPRRTQRRGV
jgi:hypothetical protein